MKLSGRTIKKLALCITWDNELFIYRSGPQLIDFFIDFWWNDSYGAGFPSRWKYAEDKIKEYNWTNIISKIIESSVDIRDFKNSWKNIYDAVDDLNQYLIFDNLELKDINWIFKVYSIGEWIIRADAISKLSHQFIEEQIDKCQSKLQNNDFSWAITNARTLLEAIMIEIIERETWDTIKNDWKVNKLFVKIQNILNLENRKDYPFAVSQIINGINDITAWLASLSNNIWDRHANKFQTHKHHAKIAVNSAMTIADFLLDSYEYQKNKK